MSKFKLPLISPLAGTTFSNLCKVLKGKPIAPRHYLKVAITFVIVIISSAFHWFDNLVFRRKVDKFTFHESPLFIIGHWRSGTTFLHNILTKDPYSGFITTYHAVFPNNLRSKWVFKNFMKLFMPDERPGDRMKISVDLPQEDEYALSNITYRSFYHFFYFPSLYRSFYRRYIRFDSLSENEEEDWELNYHNMVIKALMNTNGIRAVLKNPVNTGRMIKLLEIFPGAHFIFIIRNPIIVYLSTKKFFTQLFPTLNLEKFSNDEISRMILELYSRLLQDYLSDKKQIDPNRIVEIRFEILHQNPIEEIEKIYNKFGFSDFQELKPLFLEYLDTQKEHQKNSYSIEQQELDKVMTKLEFAMKHWNYDIPQELQVLHKNYKSGEKVITI